MYTITDNILASLDYMSNTTGVLSETRTPTFH
jgi:hypothetical protein